MWCDATKRGTRKKEMKAKLELLQVRGWIFEPGCSAGTAWLGLYPRGLCSAYKVPQKIANICSKFQPNSAISCNDCLAGSGRGVGMGVAHVQYPFC